MHFFRSMVEQPVADAGFVIGKNANATTYNHIYHSIELIAVNYGYYEVDAPRYQYYISNERTNKIDMLLASGVQPLHITKLYKSRVLGKPCQTVAR